MPNYQASFLKASREYQAEMKKNQQALAKKKVALTSKENQNLRWMLKLMEQQLQKLQEEDYSKAAIEQFIERLLDEKKIYLRKRSDEKVLFLDVIEKAKAFLEHYPAQAKKAKESLAEVKKSAPTTNSVKTLKEVQDTVVNYDKHIHAEANKFVRKMLLEHLDRLLKRPGIAQSEVNHIQLIRHELKGLNLSAAQKKRRDNETFDECFDHYLKKCFSLPAFYERFPSFEDFEMAKKNEFAMKFPVIHKKQTALREMFNLLNHKAPTLVVFSHLKQKLKTDEPIYLKGRDNATNVFLQRLDRLLNNVGEKSATVSVAGIKIRKDIFGIFRQLEKRKEHAAAMQLRSFKNRGV